MRIGSARPADPAAQHPLAVDHDGFRAVQGADRGGRLLRHPRLGEQRELGVQHDARRAADNRRRGRMDADPAAGPHRYGHPRLGEQPLEQDECAERADPAAALAAPGDQAVRAGPYGVERLLQVRDLGEDATVAHGVGHPPGGVRREDHRVRARPAATSDPRPTSGPHLTGVRHKVRRRQSAAGADPHPVAAVGCPVPQTLQRLPGRPVPGPQVEDPEPAGAADRRGEPGVRPSEGGDADDEVAEPGSRSHGFSERFGGAG